jgi:hypothetical protein
MKDRLGDAPLTTVEIPLTGQQPLSEEGLGSPHHQALIESVSLRDEHFPDRIGMREEKELPPRHRVRNFISITAGVAEQKAQAVGGNLPGEVAEESIDRAGHETLAI